MSNPNSRDQFVFDEAPEPPPYSRPMMDWNHSDWRTKLGDGRYILTVEIRESLLECMGYWPIFDAPEMLDYAGFRKFCYYAEMRGEEALDEIPDGYVPIAYLDEPEEWERRHKEQEEAYKAGLKRMKMIAKRMRGEPEIDSSSDDEEDNKEQKNLAHDESDLAGSLGNMSVKKHDSLTTVFPSNITESVLDNINLSDMPDIVRSNIASYLSHIDWWKVRSQNKICLDWPKPAPTFEYTVIVFSILHYEYGLCGVAKTIDDMIDAIFKSEVGVGDETAEISFFYLNFDPGRDEKRSLPIAIFRTEVYNEYEWEVEREHPWKKLLGIDCPLKGKSKLYRTDDDLFVSEGWIKKHGNPKYAIGSNLGVLKHWSRNLHKPKVDIDLSRFEAVYNKLNINDDDSYCHDPFPPDTEVWYNFKDYPNTYDTVAPNKSWILFDAHHSISVQRL